MKRVEVSLNINGRDYEEVIEPRRTLADFIRRNAGLTGTHLGCEQGSCGACTVRLDGRTVRSCLLLAVQVQGARIQTVESMARADGELNDIQAAFWDHHGLQCGFCTAGILMTTEELLENNPDPTEDEIRQGLSGNLCRCTGYQFIVDSIKDAAARVAARAADGASS
jgi:carbon-monoxide dehydrogenase small subunit